jgi:hypothetical protein
MTVTRKPDNSSPKGLITHRFSLDRILDAYETFGNVASRGYRFRFHEN